MSSKAKIVKQLLLLLSFKFKIAFKPKIRAKHNLWKSFGFDWLAFSPKADAIQSTNLAH